MASVHFILQGKGGVGKSLVASMLVQFLRTKTDESLVHCIDTDPVNQTLAGYKEFNAESLNILRDEVIDERSFDKLMEIIFGLPDEDHLVIDNGASSFVPLCAYLTENQAIGLLKDAGHTVYMHSVITGGQAIQDTLRSLRLLFDNAGFKAAEIVTWLNHYFGEVEMNGSRFEDFQIYRDFSERFRALIEIPHRKQSTFGRDLEGVLAEKISFEAAIHSTRSIMERQRLKSWWAAACEVMELAHFV